MSAEISVIIHTYNNEDIIRGCLESVKDFDEIVVCDMYSTDKTLEIAAEFGCKIVMHEKISFVEPARNFAISQAKNPWVLLVDSDERIPTELMYWLKNFIMDSKNYSAVKFPRANNFWGKFMEMQYPDYVTRFLKKETVNWPPQIHSAPEFSSGEICTIDKNQRQLAMIHMTCKNVKSFVTTLNNYTDHEVEKMLAKKSKVNIPFAFFKSIWLIFEKFLFKNGHKDGMHGFILCCMWGANKFLANVKYWEYCKNNNLNF